MSWLKSSALRELAESRWGHQSTWRCVYCGRSVPDGAVDHFVPRERGGTDLPWNLVPACGRCNSSKKDHEPVAWMRAAGVPDSTARALLAITRSPDWTRASAAYGYPRLVSLSYGAAATLHRAPAPLLLPANLAAVFDMDPAAWAPATALRRAAARYLHAEGRPLLSTQQLNRELELRGLVRTKRRGVYGYRGFRVSDELAGAGRFAAGRSATAAARSAERLRRVIAAESAYLD